MNAALGAVHEACTAPSNLRRAPKSTRWVAVVAAVLLAWLLATAVQGQAPAQQPSAQAGGESSGTSSGQIEALLAEKAQRTAAQRKVSSQLLDARRAADARRQETGEITEDEMVTVDIRAEVTPEVLARIRALGGSVINSVPEYRAIRARLPLDAVENLAALDAVRSIRAADVAVTREQPAEMPPEARTPEPDAVETRAVNPSEGDLRN